MKPKIKLLTTLVNFRMGSLGSFSCAPERNQFLPQKPSDVERSFTPISVRDRDQKIQPTELMLAKLSPE